jgi:hypothetical protein
MLVPPAAVYGAPFSAKPKKQLTSGRLPEILKIRSPLKNETRAWASEVRRVQEFRFAQRTLLGSRSEQIKLRPGAPCALPCRALLRRGAWNVERMPLHDSFALPHHDPLVGRNIL